MLSMFNHCIALSSIDLSSFNTEALIDMASMFKECSELRTLDLRSFNTANVSNMQNLFYNCSNLIAIAVSDNFVTTGFTSSTPQQNGQGLFTGCTSLVGGAGFTYDASKTDRYSARIDGEPTSSVHGYFRRNLPIGTKIKPDAVGDIVFNDGSAMPYEDLAALDSDTKNAKKAAAIAVIYYKGNSDSLLGETTLGVALNETERTGSNEIHWTKTGTTTGYDTDFTDIRLNISKNSAPAEPYLNVTNGSNTYYFTGDFDGRDNWEYIQSVDPTGAADAQNNYPPFYIVQQYASENGLTGDAATGWYLPTAVEMYYMYAQLSSVLNPAIEAAGGTGIATSPQDFNRKYWTSNQCYTEDAMNVLGASADEVKNYAVMVDFSTVGLPCGLNKWINSNGCHVRAIRRFD